ncbi:MAG: hypothetical protein LBT46_04625 [Planctomycetaceae bacterium]|jgi:DNA-binding beta-propeller fold protein YncE|nr:hypothetical protein [Planctomycetaceae bacterium]
MYRLFLTAAVLAAVSVSLAGNLSYGESYKGPNALAVSSDGNTLYAANTDACEIAVVDIAADAVKAVISLNGNAPHGIAVSNDNKTLYTAAGNEHGKLLKIENGQITGIAEAGHTPQGIALSPDGKNVFVCNQFSTDVWQYELPALKLVRKVKTIREPRCAVVTKDGKYVLVCNSIPLDVGNKPEDPDAMIDVAAEVSVINVADGSVSQIRLPNGSGSLHGIALSPDGKYAYVTEVLARFQIPTTQVERGWMNTAGVAIIDTTQLENANRGFVNAVLLDDVDLGAANPWGIAVSDDGKTIYIAVAGTSELIIIDAEGLHKKLAALPAYDIKSSWGGSAAEEGEQSNAANNVPNDLSFLVGLKKRVLLSGKGARAVACSGNNILVGMYFSDMLHKIDAVSLSKTEIALGAVPEWTAERRGEVWWNDATLCFQKWQSCASCHPDARMDGYNWDLLNDDLGNPKNAKSLLYSHKTPPSMWEGVRDNPNRQPLWEGIGQRLQCIRTGFQYIQFAMPDEAKCLDVDAYLAAMKPAASPYLVNGGLSERAKRGKKIFEDKKIGCTVCHPAETYFTDMKMHDVNTKCYFDRRSEFDTPTLIEVWRTAPYLHDGRYKTMQDVFKLGKHGDVEGDVGGLTDEQIDDLCEYILSL